MTAAARAGTTLLAVVASFVAMYALCAVAGAQPSPAITSALLAVALARLQHAVRIADVPAGAVRLAGIAVAAAAVGWLLHASPYAGAAVFVAALALAVWARAFGPRARAFGTLVTLPLIALLVVPAGPAHARGGPAIDLALVIAAGVVAYAMVALVGVLIPGATSAPAPAPAPEAVAAGAAERPRRAGPSVSARMALQLAVALAAAFVVGFAVFPGHAGWTVLTAFIVCSGARGRGDALYKAVLRLGGALAGTVAALLFTLMWTPAGIGEAVLIFGVLYLGVWLRERNYAYWACAMTLIFALLSRPGVTVGPEAFAERLEAILAGAICGVAAAWFIMPIRTVDVIRRRLADALVAFDDVVAHAHVAEEHPARLARFEHHLAELDGVAAPVRWHRRVFASRAQPDHPARWIELAHELRRHAETVAAHPNRAAIRRAVGISRRAIAHHGAADAPPERVPIGTALAGVHEILGGEAAPNV